MADDICGVISNSGPNGEPLACAYPLHHTTKHSWATVPAFAADRAYAPHCDQSILHAPGECRYCDLYADWQKYRTVARINFTGHTDAGLAPCPSEYFRPSEKRDRWPGNRAYIDGKPLGPYFLPDDEGAADYHLQPPPAPGMISRLGNSIRASRHRWSR